MVNTCRFQNVPPCRSLTPLGIVPAPLDQRGRCVPLEIDGELGVFISVGNWFSLRSLTWRKLASPPLDPIALFPNALFGLGGRPTLFGAPVKELKNYRLMVFFSFFALLFLDL